MSTISPENTLQDSHETRWHFLREMGDNDGIVAVLIPEDYESIEQLPIDAFVTCYAHVGQHSEGIVAYFLECENADFEDYATLLAELVELGYVPKEVRL